MNAPTTSAAPKQAPSSASVWRSQLGHLAVVLVVPQQLVL